MIGNQSELLDGFPVLVSTTQENDKLACAYKEDTKYYTNYWIKRSESGTLFNPENLMPANSFKAKKFKGQEIIEYISVSQECFEYYLHFLKTKSITAYKSAERTRI